MSVREKYASFPPLAEDLMERLRGIPALLERHAVRLAYLFGSCARSPEEAEDIDLAILPDVGFHFQAFYADLSELLGTDRLDLVELPQAPLWLRQEVLATGTCIYEKPSGERVRWESAVLALLRDAISRATLRGKGGSMGINQAFLQDALSELSKVAAELKKYVGLSLHELETNLSLRWTVERGLLAGLTLVFQVADHILAQHFGLRPDTYEGLLRELRACGVISESLYARLRGSGGFRNILVHEYVRIDLRHVAEILRGAPEIFEAFIREIQAWVSQQEGGKTS